MKHVHLISVGKKTCPPYGFRQVHCIHLAGHRLGELLMNLNFVPLKSKCYQMSSRRGMRRDLFLYQGGQKNLPTLHIQASLLRAFYWLRIKDK